MRGIMLTPARTVVAPPVSPTQTIPPFARSGNLFVTSGKGRFYAPSDGTIENVRASVGTSPTGAAIICDVHKNGVTIFTTQANRPSIAIGANVSSESVPDDTAIAKDDYLTVDIDQIGSVIAGADLTVQILWTPS